MQHAGHRHIAGIAEPARDLARRIDAAHGLADHRVLGIGLHQHSRRQATVLHIARQLDCVEDLLIAGAAADIAAKPLLDFLPISERIDAKRCGRRHHHARDTVAALAGSGLVKGLLQHAQFTGLGQRFDRLDGRAMCLRDRQQTRLHQHAIHEHRAGAAFTGAAAFLVTGKIEIVTDEVEQALMWLGTARDLSAVDCRSKLKIRHRPSPIRR